MAAIKVPVWSPTELHEHLDAYRPFTILDVRNSDDFSAWKIEGRTPLRTINIPYFDLLDLEQDEQDVAAAVARAVPARLEDKLPGKTDPILVVCARGDTSPLVADGLRRQGYFAFNLEGGMAAWGEHYEMRPIVDSQRLTILQISRPAKGCLSYLVASGGMALVVDPARHTHLYTRLATERGWRITAVIDSHLQADHLSGGVALARALDVDYRLHSYDAIHPEDLMPAAFPFRYLHDGAVIALGETSVRALHFPGHTLGMTNLLVDEHYLLSGDTLFIDTIGRPDLGGKAQSWAPLLYRSLERLMQLPGDTVVLPTHFSSMHEADHAGCYRATLDALRKHNPGLRKMFAGLVEFTTYITSSLPAHPQTYDDIRRVNIGLLEADETKASELEIGKNRCALGTHESSAGELTRQAA